MKAIDNKLFGSEGERWPLSGPDKCPRGRKEATMRRGVATKLLAIAVLAATFIGFAETTASAGVKKWIRKHVKVPYTYYEWETQTRYRTVRRPVTRTYYRTERRLVTTYVSEYRWVPVHYRGPHGRMRTRYVWQEVRVPRQTYRMVRVPYQETRYELVREPYTVRVRVAKRGHRYPPGAFSMRVGDWRLGFAW